MKFAGFTYKNSINIGDYIQSLAAEQHFPKVVQRFNRDNLANISSKERYIMVMNGWFTHSPVSCFPPSPAIIPIYWGMHITNWNKTWQHLKNEQCIEHFNANAPIGCRDSFTTQELKQLGIDTFYSKCLTLTFPKRKSKPTNGKAIIVDAEHIPMPDKIKKHAICIRHNVPHHLTENEKYNLAIELLDFYKQKASIVYTTRLHCALPCLAMGIPVVFFGNSSDYRISLLPDIGLNINDIKGLGLNNYANKLEGIDNVEMKNLISNTEWSPAPLDLEEIKENLLSKFKNKFNNTISRYGM